MPQLQVTDLAALGATLPVDHDHVLRKGADAELLLIRLAPQAFREERHEGAETIIALNGTFGLDTGDHVTRVAQGSMITVPPGVTHRFTEDSDATILVFFGRGGEEDA